MPAGNANSTSRHKFDQCVLLTLLNISTRGLPICCQHWYSIQASQDSYYCLFVATVLLCLPDASKPARAAPRWCLTFLIEYLLPVRCKHVSTLRKIFCKVRVLMTEAPFCKTDQYPLRSSSSRKSSNSFLSLFPAVHLYPQVDPFSFHLHQSPAVPSQAPSEQDSIR
jgi:hypothetical protein